MAWAESRGAGRAAGTDCTLTPRINASRWAIDCETADAAVPVPGPASNGTTANRTPSVARRWYDQERRPIRAMTRTAIAIVARPATRVFQASGTYHHSRITAARAQ